MGIRRRVFLVLTILLGLSLLVLRYNVSENYKLQFRKATEEPLVDISRLLATHVTRSKGGLPDVGPLIKTLTKLNNQTLAAAIYDYRKEGTELEVYVTDSKGIVTFHSKNPSFVGEDFSDWRDVFRSLQGHSGARTTRSAEDAETSILFISTPLFDDGNLYGVISVGKSAKVVNGFVESARWSLTKVASFIFILFAVCAWFLATSLVRPLERLTRHVQSLSEPDPPPPPVTNLKEVALLSHTIQEMKQEIEGKRYVENYVQTLAHALKTPIFAIKGSCEILDGLERDAERRTFIENILSEAERMDKTVEKLLLLASVERRPAPVLKTFNLSEVISEEVEKVRSLASIKDITLTTPDTRLRIKSDKELLSLIIENGLKNAVDHAPTGSTILLSAEAKDGMTHLSIFNEAEPIPDYALAKLFDRFYSLSNKVSGKKSSGLGLAIAKEAARVLGASLSIKNVSSGVQLDLLLPKGD